MEEEPIITQDDEAELLEQAKLLMQEENWQDAINLLGQCQQNNDMSIEGLSALAYCYSRNKDYKEASQIYEQLCDRRPNDAKWFYHLAFQYRALGDLAAVVENYERCLELSPRWIRAYLELGQVYEELDSSDKALKAYRDGIQAYKEFMPNRQKDLALIYSRICTKAAKLLQSREGINEKNMYELEFLLKESTVAEPENADTWYRLGNSLLQADRPDEALKNLKKAQSLAPKKEYIAHKMGQAFLKKNDPEQALKIYESIPRHKRPAYILHGIADCLLNKGQTMEAARYLFQATQKEPEKFYHHRDLGQALTTLGDRDQAIKELETANELYKKDNGKDFNKILNKIKEVRNMPQGERIVFRESILSIPKISYGTITKYNSDRGFGFIKDESNYKTVFFHIKSMKNRTLNPATGTKVKFVKEMSEKGLKASKVWILQQS
jgi:tetratricopeptide (TPR) repeat protein